MSESDREYEEQQTREAWNECEERYAAARDEIERLNNLVRLAIEEKAGAFAENKRLRGLLRGYRSLLRLPLGS